MEIRNNTPSFGMAFIKPAAYEMAEFTEQVTRGKKPKFIARGLKQLQREHQADKYVDIHYLPSDNGFLVSAKSGLGASVEETVNELLGKTPRIFRQGEVVNPSRLEKISAEADEIMKRNANASNLKQICVGLNQVLKAGREVFRAVISPKEILPGELRAASTTAKNIEKNMAKAEKAEKLIDNSLK